MKKNLSRVFVLLTLLLCLGTSTVSAQPYSKSYVANPDGSRYFYGVDNSKNTKIYAGLGWYFTVTNISFSCNVSPTPGMAFTPMRKTSSNVYILCGAKKGWAKVPTGKQYPGWGDCAGEVGDYYLGVRLDDRLTSCIASVAGDWNAN